jgi:ABC-2 type transport system ATP-binding protein
VRSPQALLLAETLTGPNVTVTAVEPGVLEIEGLDAAAIGDAALAKRIAIHELTPQQASLEQAFMDLTRDDVEFRAA